MSNALNWFEIPVRDLQASMTFYAKVTGQKLEILDAAIPHAVFSHGPTGVHGALVVDPERKIGSTGGAVIYLDVPDGIAPALERVRAHGGTIVKPLTDIGPHGTYALIEDRDGNLVGLHTEKKGA